MKMAQLEAEVFRMIQAYTESPDPVRGDTHLVRQLGMSSVEAMMLIGELEDRYGIEIDVSVLRQVQTAGDLFRVVVDRLMSQ